MNDLKTEKVKTKEVIFGGNWLSLEDIVDIARQEKQISLNHAPDFIAKIQKGADFLKKKLDEDGSVYGVTTGYGDSCTQEIPEDYFHQLPIHLTRFHGCGLGKYFDDQTTRAILATRLSSLSQGYSGVTYDLLEQFERFIKNDILPQIPEEGSVGASGDLTPLSYVAATMIGEREVRYQGKILPAKDVLSKLKIEPTVLKPKEGLAIMNGTAAMTAVACLAYKRAEYLGKLSMRITAMASIALLGNSFHFDEKLFSVKPHPGQIKAAQLVREDLDTKTDYVDSIRLQDRYSIRCAPHITGVLFDVLPFMKQTIENELNSTNDNPVIDPDNERVLHGGHFYGGHIAFVMDSMKNCVANIADMLDRQMALLVDFKFNHGLPANLCGDTSKSAMLNHGLKALQIGVSAWTAEALKNTMPASVFSRSTECHNQDKVSMGTISARDCIRVLELTEQVTAALLITVTQALAIRIKNKEVDESSLSENIKTTLSQVSEISPFIVEDRPLEKELRQLIAFIQTEQLVLG